MGGKWRGSRREDGGRTTQECKDGKKKKLKRRKRWWRRGRIKKECADDVIAQLPPPAPCARLRNVWANPQEGDYYAETQDTAVHLPRLKSFAVTSQTPPGSYFSPPFPRRWHSTPTLLRPAWHGGQTGGGFDLTQRRFLWTNTRRGGKGGEKKSPVLVFIHIHAVEFAPVCSERGK